MNKSGLGLVVGLSVAVGMLSGCRYEVGCDPDGGDGFGQDWGKVDQDCVPFCDQLVSCGLVEAPRYNDCLDYCRKNGATNPAQNHEACQCVINDRCQKESDYQCPGAPFTPPGYQASSGSSGSVGGTTGSWATSTTTTTTSTTTSGGTSSTTGAIVGTTTGTSGTSGSTGGSTGGSSGSSGGTTGSSSSCHQNIDCAYNQDCVSGECMTRCHASCECATGQTCVNNYCASNLPPPQSCLVDCECNAGQHCVNGACQ
jgi:hypothetical protein